MDVESAMRINELAKELTKSGFADSSEDASRLAEEFLQKKVIPNEGLSRPEGQDKIDIQLERMERKFNNDISSLKDRMNSVIDKLNAVCDYVRNIKVQSAPGAEKVEQKRLEQPREENQRTGAFKPGDVDINKVFYCGTR